MEYIHEKFGKFISRRTFYNYKKKILEQILHKEANRFIFSDIKHFNSNIRKRFYLKIERDIIKKSPYMSRLQIQIYDNFGGIPATHSKVLFSTSRRIEESKILIHRIEKESGLRNTRITQIPVTATMREEFVSCNNKSCKEDKHGPYLYAYWRDSDNKIRKKYIGKT
ncbi:hypothetical protein [Candidatus Nitrosocosmicus hydrocola]|uniref:hypothetical protein n=1 Tax=Candidatus Nitrosocosmicus hydrocola TaxID=1826872 RepID=UPI0011E5F51C|nr:hypothetical protein [Candidatus Nitrosocosmicus hydrocola]